MHGHKHIASLLCSNRTHNVRWLGLNHQCSVKYKLHVPPLFLSCFCLARARHVETLCPAVIATLWIPSWKAKFNFYGRRLWCLLPVNRHIQQAPLAHKPSACIRTFYISPWASDSQYADRGIELTFNIFQQDRCKGTKKLIVIEQVQSPKGIVVLVWYKQGSSLTNPQSQW